MQLFHELPNICPHFLRNITSRRDAGCHCKRRKGHRCHLYRFYQEACAEIPQFRPIRHQHPIRQAAPDLPKRRTQKALQRFRPTLGNVNRQVILISRERYNRKNRPRHSEVARPAFVMRVHYLFTLQGIVMIAFTLWRPSYVYLL